MEQMVTECCLSSTLHLKPVSTQSISTQTWRPGFGRWSPRGGSPPSRRGSWPTESHRPPPSHADLFPSRRFRGEALRGRFLPPSGHLHPLLKFCEFTFQSHLPWPRPRHHESTRNRSERSKSEFEKYRHISHGHVLVVGYLAHDHRARTCFRKYSQGYFSYGAGISHSFHEKELAFVLRFVRDMETLLYSYDSLPYI